MATICKIEKYPRMPTDDHWKPVEYKSFLVWAVLDDNMRTPLFEAAGEDYKHFVECQTYVRNNGLQIGACLTCEG